MKKMIAILVLAGAASAQDPKPDDKKDEKKGEIEATIVSIKGVVDIKRPEDKDWVEAKKDMKLKKGSEICTSVGATATLLFTGNIKIDVKAVTQAKIEQLAKAGNKVNADVKLKFGTVDVDIQKGDIKADMKVATPNSTTSVSGSSGRITAWAMSDCRDISIRAWTGEWKHQLKFKGIETTLTNNQVFNNYGQFGAAMFNNYQMMNFDFGKMHGEFGFIPQFQPIQNFQGFLAPYEWGSERFCPYASAFIKPAGLPLPPPPPPQP